MQRLPILQPLDHDDLRSRRCRFFARSRLPSGFWQVSFLLLVVISPTSPRLSFSQHRFRSEDDDDEDDEGNTATADNSSGDKDYIMELVIPIVSTVASAAIIGFFGFLLRRTCVSRSQQQPTQQQQP